MCCVELRLVRFEYMNFCDFELLVHVACIVWLCNRPRTEVGKLYASLFGVLLVNLAMVRRTLFCSRYNFIK
jgi:hypothetical protein